MRARHCTTRRRARAHRRQRHRHGPGAGLARVQHHLSGRQRQQLLDTGSWQARRSIRAHAHVPRSGRRCNLSLPLDLPAGTVPNTCRATRHRIDRQGKGKGRSRPVSRVLSWTAIPLGAASPRRSSNLPGPDAGRAMRSLFGLAPGGVCRAGPLPDSRCALTAPFHPCLIRRSRRSPGHRRYLSVALSVGSRRPGVTWHRALWSPDFPRHPQGVTRLSGRLRRAHCPTPGRA